MSLMWLFLFSAIELIKDLMEYEVKDNLLKGLVKLLRPAKEDLLRRPDILDGTIDWFLFSFLHVCCK